MGLKHRIQVMKQLEESTGEMIMTLKWYFLLLIKHQKVLETKAKIHNQDYVKQRENPLMMNLMKRQPIGWVKTFANCSFEKR